MPDEYTRKPLTADGANRSSNAGEKPTGRPTVWTLHDTGLRAIDLCGFTSRDALWKPRQPWFEDERGRSALHVLRGRYYALGLTRTT